MIHSDAALLRHRPLTRCLPTTPSPPLQVAECKFLHNRLVDVVNFMENIAVKDGVEKVQGRG